MEAASRRLTRQDAASTFTPVNGRFALWVKGRGSQGGHR